MDEKERELFYFGSYLTTNLVLTNTNTNIPVKFNKIYSTVNVAVPSITYNNISATNSIILGNIINMSNIPDKDFTKDIIVNNNPAIIKIKKSIFGKLSLELIKYSSANWETGNLVIQPFTLTYNSTTTTNLDSNYVSPYCYDTNIQFNQIGQDIDGRTAANQSGHSVSLSSDGKILAVGEILDDAGYIDAGIVKVYNFDGNTWNQFGTNINGGLEATAKFGFSVDLNNNGTVLAASAINYNIQRGIVKVYYWSGINWVQRGNNLTGDSSGDYFGWRISLNDNGNVIAITALYNDNNSLVNNGQVKVYEWNGGSWVQRGITITGNAANDNLGHSVSLNGAGNVLAVGAQQADGNGTDSGEVRVYEWNGTAWIQRGTNINGDSSGDILGSSVSLNNAGNVVATGAMFYNNNTGYIKIFEWNGTTWIQRGSNIVGESTNDTSSYSISLNSDGSIVAIGATGNDGVNGTDSGHVRVYHWNGTVWNKIGADIDGEAANDAFGHSVSLSSDGTTVAIGAILNDGVNGADSGHVKVYSMPSC